MRPQTDSLKTFDRNKQRLDEFYHSVLSEKEELVDLWKIVQMVLVVSHGQANIERGFSVNDDFLVPNLRKETLVGLRRVYDTMKSSNLKPHEFEVTDKMIKYCRYG